MVKEALEGGLVFMGIQYIPFVNFLYDAYQFGKAVAGGIEALWYMQTAENAVRSATSVVSLQRATARNVLAQNEDTLKLAGSLLEAFGDWSAMRHAVKVHLGDAVEGAGEGAAHAPPPEKARHPLRRPQVQPLSSRMR